MSIDFSALTCTVGAGLPEVRACLLLSRDGLALAAHPAEQEGRAMAAWARLIALGDVRRGFLAVGTEVWAFSRRGPYAALAIGDTGARPGLLLDRLDGMLLAADDPGPDEGRAHRSAAAPSREPGVVDPAPSPPAAALPIRPSVSSQASRRFRISLHRGTAPVEMPEPDEELSEEEPAALKEESPDDDHLRQEHTASMDPVALAREFAGLVANEEHRRTE